MIRVRNIFAKSDTRSRRSAAIGIIISARSIFSKKSSRKRQSELFFAKCSKCGDRISADPHAMEMHSRTCSKVKCKDCGQMVDASIDAIEAHASVCIPIPSKRSWVDVLRPLEDSLVSPFRLAADSHRLAQLWFSKRRDASSSSSSSSCTNTSSSSSSSSSFSCIIESVGCSPSESLVSTKQADSLSANVAAELKTVVIDSGSGICKAGFAGKDSPSSSFPSIIGWPMLDRTKENPDEAAYRVGSDALDVHRKLSLSYPLEHGIVTDWEGMAKVWHHTFYNDLRVDPECCHVLLTEAPMSPKANREKLGSIMFEQLGVRGVYIQLQAVLSLYASSRKTGLFLDSGDGISHTVPIFEGFAIPHAVQRINFAGRDLTAYLAHILSERGHILLTPLELESVRVAKERLCYVASSFEESQCEADNPEKRRRTFQTNSDEEALLRLPSGGTIALGNERYRCPEALFQPHIAGKELPGLQELVCQSIGKCDIDLQRALYSSVVLSGGSTAFPSFDTRLEAEIKALCPAAMQPIVKIIAPVDRINSVWKGGSMVASMPAFQDSWISRKEYLEAGRSIIHRCSRA